MSQVTDIQVRVPSDDELARQEQVAAVVAAVNPATVMAFVQIGAALVSFAGALFGGKKGAALTEIARVVQGFGAGLLTVPNELQKIMTQIDGVIGAIDQTQLSKLAPIHDQLMGYLNAFPGGIPNLADTGNPNYVQAHQGTAEALSYFQSQQRGPAVMMAALSHATNSRLELAVTSWPCWFTNGAQAQPRFTQELNLSTGQLSSYIGQMRKKMGGGYSVKKIIAPRGPAAQRANSGTANVGDGPIERPETVGWRVMKGTQVVWEKMDPDAFGQANQMATNLNTQAANEKLAGYIGTASRWAQMTASSGGAGIAAALNVGDARSFMRLATPSALVMEDQSAEGEEALVSSDSTAYRALPMRDVLLDVLTSKAMRDRHGLLTKGADRRSVATWFEKAFFRQPSASELTTLMQVVSLFGSNALFGCLAYSSEYESRFGDGLPTQLAQPVVSPVPEPVGR